MKRNEQKTRKTEKKAKTNNNQPAYQPAYQPKMNATIAKIISQRKIQRILLQLRPSSDQNISAREIE